MDQISSIHGTFSRDIMINRLSSIAIFAIPISIYHFLSFKYSFCGTFHIKGNMNLLKPLDNEV